MKKPLSHLGLWIMTSAATWSTESSISWSVANSTHRCSSGRGHLAKKIQFTLAR